MFESVKMEENVHSNIQDGLNKNEQQKSTSKQLNRVMTHPWMLGVLLLFVGIPAAMGHRMSSSSTSNAFAVIDSIALSDSTSTTDSLSSQDTIATTDSLKVVKRRTRIDLIHADSAIADRSRFPDAQLLIGHVKLKHASMYMYCDSAFIYQDKNSFEAFSNVRCEQGDTLFIYGDYLYYDGEAQIARLRDNVRLINGHTTLTTDSLNYDRLFHLGYYFDGGTLTDDRNTLVSDWGEYSPNTKWAVFNHDVELHNDQLNLYSDTLKYNTDNKEAYILGPSTIDSKTNHIYSEKGIYYTAQGQATLLDRSVLTNGSKRMVGDSLFYDRVRGYGEAFGDVDMKDSQQKNILKGDYVFYNEIMQSAFSTGRAQIIDFSQGDSLFLHADTLELNTTNYATDSVRRSVLAYHHVRFFREDIQGVCDSLAFESSDSCLTLYKNPILWNMNKQLYGEEIKVFLNDSTVKKIVIPAQAFSIERKDSLHYDQISGKVMEAFMDNGLLHQVDVTGNVQVVYYPQDSKTGEMIGMNVSESSVLRMIIANNVMQRMTMSPKATGTLYPMDQIPDDKKTLEGFAWFDYIRPLNSKDIFDWRAKHADQVLHKSTRKKPISPDRNLVNPITE